MTQDAPGLAGGVLGSSAVRRRGRVGRREYDGGEPHGWAGDHRSTLFGAASPCFLDELGQSDDMDSGHGDHRGERPGEERRPSGRWVVEAAAATVPTPDRYARVCLLRGGLAGPDAGPASKVPDSAPARRSPRGPDQLRK